MIAAAPNCSRARLLAALKIVQRGDLPLRDLIGAFAGEIGQTQFLPSSYIKYGVDFDGNGHVDLRHSVPDVLASTANLLHTSGFKMGAPYGEGTANFEAMREWNRATIYPQDDRVFRRSAGGAVGRTVIPPPARMSSRRTRTTPLRSDAIEKPLRQMNCRALPYVPHPAGDALTVPQGGVANAVPQIPLAPAVIAFSIRRASTAQ